MAKAFGTTTHIDVDNVLVDAIDWKQELERFHIFYHLPLSTSFYEWKRHLHGLQEATIHKWRFSRRLYLKSKKSFCLLSLVLYLHIQEP